MLYRLDTRHKLVVENVFFAVHRLILLVGECMASGSELTNGVVQHVC